MSNKLRLMGVLAHPDDESLGLGGTLARYASEGVETYLVTATRGERGRFGDDGEHPGLDEVGRRREAELREAAQVLGVREVQFLDYVDGDLDQADPGEAVRKIVAHLRRVRPHIVITFGPDGAYGHPDHIAISQFCVAAVTAAADTAFSPDGLPPHRVAKLYFMAWPPEKWEAYQAAFKRLVSRVDGVDRQAVPWPDWAITTRIDTAADWPTVWQAIRCHRTQMAIYGELEKLPDEVHHKLWGSQEFYRVFSLVNGGRTAETDLFEGLREERPARKESRSREFRPQALSADLPVSPRSSAPEMEPDEFRRLGHDLIDRIATFLSSIRERPVTRWSSAETIRTVLKEADAVSEGGRDPSALVPWISERLFDHSLHNGHPRFWGYVTSSAAPIGMLGDLLAASVNANVGGWKLSPMATELESEAVGQIADLLGYPPGGGGLLVSGGNLANIVGFLAARRAALGSQIRQKGVGAAAAAVRVYASRETHTWIEKAADISGLGTDSIRWIRTDGSQRIDLTELDRQIRSDLADGEKPLLVVGTAGTVSTGAIDPLLEMAEVCRKYGIWFHVDGAYGGPAAVLREEFPELEGISKADSVAVDPHKWMYVPLEAGCVLVRDIQLLRDTFSYHPPYYHFDEEVINYFDLGLQNSRGFRGLKVWLTLQWMGREGLRNSIAEDIALARKLHDLVRENPELEPGTQGLSITTFRYVPEDLQGVTDPETGNYLNELNRTVLERIEAGGQAFLSNAIVDDRFLLRLCIVNFRTTREDIEALPRIVERHGREADRELRRTLGHATPV